MVLTHDDFIGEIYTLYAHLADLAEGIETGTHVARGQRIGRMGNTASTGIPMIRAHLHFEIGVFFNQHFEDWGRQRFKNGLNHGVAHGWNLAPVDPLAVYGAEGMPLRFSMAEHLVTRAPAFCLGFATTEKPDYFKRYPLLWQGGEQPFQAIVLGVSEGGVPLWGRPATQSEHEPGARNRPVVTAVDPVLLGRNGMRLIQPAGAGWQLSTLGQRWLDILVY